MNFRHTLVIAFAALLTTILSAPSLASDTAKEKRWADQIVDTLVDGDAVWLQAGQTKFLGIYTETATKPAKGAVIILHGAGVHPDWADVVNPLRVHLPEHGWTTLSVQMPILANDIDENGYPPVFPEIAPRMKVAIDFLKSKGFKTIAVAGHSMGATMAAYYLANNPNPVKGLVCVGVSGAVFNAPGLRYFDTLPKLNKLPILDIYGSEDHERVLASIAPRQEIARKSGNTHYTQKQIPGANHFMQGADKELVQEVSSWLDKNITH